MTRRHNNVAPTHLENKMTFVEAINCCHVRSAVYRKEFPERKYWKNHPVALIERIPIEDVIANDWEEYDPRDDDDTSLFMYND